MKRSVERILTTHVGSLPRPEDLMALYASDAPDDKLQPRLRAAVADIVHRQAETGVDVVNDGEYRSQHHDLLTQHDDLGFHRRARPKEVDENCKNPSAEFHHPAEDHPILRLTPTG